jgi:chaperonin cofactor prefoldin
MQLNDNTSDSGSSIEGVDEIYNEIMYHVLGQFLVTKDNKNIATVLSELTSELKTFRKTMSRDVEHLSNILTNLGMLNINENFNASENENIVDDHSKIISSGASSSPSLDSSSHHPILSVTENTSDPSSLKSEVVDS